MTEYIEREAVLEIAMQYCPDDDGSCSKAGVDIRDMLDEIEAIPAADVVARDCYDRLLAENDELRKERPVVRCADCKYNITPDKLYARCNFNYAIGPQDFFCKAGERKDGDGDV